MKLPGRDASLGGRELLLLLLGFGLIAGLLGLEVYNRQRDGIRSAARDELVSIAQLKVEGIQRWRQERLADARWLLDGSSFPQLVRDHFALPADESRRAFLVRWLEGWCRSGFYSSALLLDPTLAVRLAGGTAPAALPPPLVAAARQALATRRVAVADLYRDAASGAVRMQFLVPAVDPSQPDQAFAVLALEADPSRYLFPHVQSWPTPSPTAETILARREGEEVVFLNPLRHRPDPPLTLRHPVATSDFPASRAARGEFGVAEGRDYRGVAVLAATAAVPDSPWFIVTKRDLAAVDRPVRQWAGLLGVVMPAVSLAAATGIGYLWRTREVRFTRHELAERARSAAALQARDAELQSLYHAMSEMVVLHEIVTDAAGRAIDYRLLDCNPAFESITGVPRSRAIGALASELFGTQPPPYMDIYQRVARTGEPSRLVTYFAPMGKHFEISVTSPRPGHFATVTNDVTERRRHEVERERFLAELRRKNEELESMLYVASHDLRAPLVNIQGFGHRLDRACRALLAPAPAAPDPDRPTPAAEVARALRYIQLSAEKMDVLIEGLLRVSRYGRAPVAPQPVDMNRLLRDVAATLETQIQQAGATLDLAPLPPCTGDRHLLNQVFTNLLDNALKYRAPDRPLRITVTAATDGREVTCCVADTGLGIAPDHIDKIWEMFHRLDPQGPVSGEGIGLNIVRRIVEAHQGSIRVESSRGAGSRFFVVLPAAPPSTPTAPAPPEVS
jgi:signal transduction histidine kinase